jgi:hypothetical protein
VYEIRIRSSAVWSYYFWVFKGDFGMYIVRISGTSIGWFFHKIVIFGAPDYLSSRLVSGRSPRHRFLVIPNSVPVTVVFVYEMCCLLPLGPLLVLVLLSWKQSDANLDIATKNCQNFRNFRRNLEELHLNYEAKNCL